MDENAIWEKLQGGRKITRCDFNNKLHSNPCDYLLIVCVAIPSITTVLF